MLYWLQSGVGVMVGVEVAVEVGNMSEIPLWQLSSNTRSTIVLPCTGSATGWNLAIKSPDAVCANSIGTGGFQVVGGVISLMIKKGLKLKIIDSKLRLGGIFSHPTLAWKR